MPPRKRVKLTQAKPDNVVVQSPSMNKFELTINWLETVKKLKKKDMILQPEDMEISSDEKEDDTGQFNIKELEKPVKKLISGFTKEEIKNGVMFECEWRKCCYEGNNENEFFMHVNQDHVLPICESENETSSLKCFWDLCHFVAASSQEFSKHVNYHSYHTSLKTYGLSLSNLVILPQCLLDSKMRNNIEKVHKLPELYQCLWSNCDLEFPSMQSFLEHVDFHSSSTYPYKRDIQNRAAIISKRTVICRWSECAKICSNVYNLKTHLKQHTRANSIGCHNCGALFNSKVVLVDHCLRQVVNCREFQCEECFKYFPSERILHDHERGHVNYYKCTQCDMSCFSKSALNKHILYRHSTKSKTFICDECQFTCVTKRDLDNHKNVHIKDNMFICEEYGCEFSCRSWKTLKRHDAREHRQEPQVYQCNECEKKYSCGNILSKHMIKKHDFRLPNGHSRFIYKPDEHGIYKLQTKRIESLEVSKEIIQSRNIAVRKRLSEVSAEESTSNFETSSIKRIEDFSIIKEYMKFPNPKKKIILEVIDHDQGRLLKKETYNVDELKALNI